MVSQKVFGVIVLSPWSAKGLRGKAGGNMAKEGSPSETDNSDTPQEPPRRAELGL